MIIKEKLHITGRGIILVASCKDNGIDTCGISVDEAFAKLPKKGTELQFEGKSYITTGSIEAFRTLMDPPHLGDGVGIVVREKPNG